jgi:methionyl-tRNA formyltransferase
MTSKNPKSNLEIVFFGTGQTSLEALQSLSEEFDIKLVVTKPSATNSAGKEFKNSVHEWAQNNNLKIITPANKTDMIDLISSHRLQHCLGIVLDYGMIIPREVIDYFKLGILNSHFSLLPKYRGSNPIRAAILAGDDTTGVTIIKITPGLDDGPILSWAEIDLDNMDSLKLRNKLSELNCALLNETIKLYASGELELIDQDDSEITHTTKTTKEDGLFDPTKDAERLYRETLAYAGWPKSYLVHNGNNLIITKARPSKIKVTPSKLEVINNKLHYGCKNGSLVLDQVQPAGKAAMEASAFINGYLNKN